MCNGELGDKQTQEDADEQRSQWRQAREVAIGTQPSVMSEPKSTREAAEQALIALAAKMKALQARNEELEARVAVMQADKKQPQADASQCCYIFPPFHLPIYIPVCRLLRKEG